MAQTRPWQAAMHYGIAWPQDKTSGQVRLTCPFYAECQTSFYGALNINVDEPHSPIYCHACHVRGDLLTLMWGWKHGCPPTAGKLRGAEFTEMRDDLLAIHGTQQSTCAKVEQVVTTPEPPSTPANVPLCKSDKEAVRELEQLHEQGTLDESSMPPLAANFRRQRPWMTDELLAKWNVTYLPKKRKSILQGRWIYPVYSIKGEILWWQGRDPEYEQKLRHWESKGRPEKGKPMKHRLPNGVHKGLELFGQQAERLQEPGYREFVAEHGIILVEGLNDVLRLDAAGIVALGIMGKEITAEQCRLAWRFARQLGQGKLTLWGDNDAEGVEGALRSLAKLAQHGPVLSMWSPDSHGGQFAGQEPEHLSDEALSFLVQSLRERHAS